MKSHNNIQHIHGDEKEQFVELFKQEGIDNVKQRLEILEIFLANESHITINELSNLLEENDYHFDVDLIKDTLELLCNFGFAQQKIFEGRDVLYEHMHIGQHHDHIICTKCKKIVEFKNDQIETLQKEVASFYNFHLLQHKLEIYGICSDCLKKRVQLMPLMLAKPGETLIIKEIKGGRRLQKRLTDMGLRPDDEIDVITSRGRGHFVLAVNGKRFVLGRGMVQNIYVEPKIVK